MEEIKTFVKSQIAMYNDNMGNFSSVSFVYGALEALTDVLDEIEHLENKNKKK